MEKFFSELNEECLLEDKQRDCEHSWVYKILFDHTVENVCEKCHKREKPIARSQFLVDNDVYVELAVGQKWCFKFQPKGKPIIMCSHVEKETAAEMMIKELKLAFSRNFS